MIFLGSVVTHNIVTGRCGQQVTDGQGVHLQYKIGDVWHAATTVATGAVRKYELQLLRRQGSRQDAEARVDQEIALASRVRSFCEDSSCNKDERKDTDEPSCGRRTAGILVAVTPCLQSHSCTSCVPCARLTFVCLCARTK